jgi:hypothetical protein
MARLNQHRQWRRGTAAAAALMLSVLAAACLAWPAVAAQDDEDDVPDLNALRAKADAGNVRAQTRLADFCIASDDFTNAVHWYRKAAEQDDVTAQLSLASLLMAGRGTAKNPPEAAKWLRAAADRIEGKKPAVTDAAAATTNAPSAATQVSPPAAIVISRTNVSSATNTQAAPPVRPTNTVAKATPTTNITRVPRADALQVAEPKLQDTQPVLRPPAVGK